MSEQTRHVTISFGGKKTLTAEQEAAWFQANGWERVGDGWRMGNDGKPLVMEVNLDAREPKPGAKRPDGLLTPDEAAAFLACSIKTLFGHVDDGSLRYIDVSRKGSKRRRIKFDGADLDEFKQKHRKQEASPCQSIGTKARRSTTSISKSEVVDFTALRVARAAAKRKP